MLCYLIVQKLRVCASILWLVQLFVFEPGQKRTIELVEVAGDKKIYGFAGRVMGGL